MEFSYKNIYNSEKNKEFMQNHLYLIDDKFFIETENHELPEGVSLDVTEYENNPYSLQKCTLKNAGKIIYEYLCFYSHTFIFDKIIRHKNGHRYYPFHADLYGISFLDVDTLEVYNYIPEGYEHDEKYRCGESFIITDIYYDKISNLIAYGGCYWAMPYGVMVGDFSNPLNFNPYLISIHDILNFKNNIYFKEWKDGRLYVTCGNEEKSVSAEEIKKLIERKMKNE